MPRVMYVSIVPQGGAHTKPSPTFLDSISVVVQIPSPGALRRLRVNLRAVKAHAKGLDQKSAKVDSARRRGEV